MNKCIMLAKKDQEEERLCGEASSIQVSLGVMPKHV